MLVHRLQERPYTPEVQAIMDKAITAFEKLELKKLKRKQAANQETRKSLLFDNDYENRFHSTIAARASPTK